MKSKEDIEEKIADMKVGLQQYIDNWNTDIKLNGINGLPLRLETDINYNIIKNQIEALEWVLKEK